MSQPAKSPETISQDLPKAYDPSAIEQRWAEYWVRERLFDVPTPKAGAPPLDSEMWDQSAKELPAAPFTMMLPPPNVTGRLHMGHMFEQTEMDILTRWHRMRGQTAVWVPGTDHAGIATQMLVERQLAAEGTSRRQLGRAAFVEKVWAWRDLYGGAILDQMKRLGASVDWSREYFTMDDRLSPGVQEAFVRLYEQGLIYRGAYIVNWDPSIQTAVSDLEVEHEERTGKLYHIRYPLAEGPLPDGIDSIVIATTRPETMLGDVAVAVNPNDERYLALHGRLVRLPLSEIDGNPARAIPILADDWARPEFGTGAVKVTPAHDPNDFAIGRRHHLPSPSIFDETAHVLLPGSPYHGLDRFAARERIVADLDALGLLVKVEDHTSSIGISQRTGVVIEPRLSQQWFVKIQPLADKAIEAVDRGYITFTPDQYRKTYDEWMKNIHDWCISRQLWWGHRIPAWHCKDCAAITVSRDTPTHCATCRSSDITQETDVLDTWFSSGLVPFTSLGWPGTQGPGPSVQGPEKQGPGPSVQGPESPGTLSPEPWALNPVLTPDLAAFYPTSLLVTGFDILFFWVARMIMLGCHFMLDVPASPAQQAEFTAEERSDVARRGGRPLRFAVPFQAVHIHALVRDANREKMSKTKGNVIDPIDVINRFGTDAVRFTLASMASPGTDIAFSEARTEGNRAFANKIWNAARFLFMNLDRAREAGISIDLKKLPDPMNFVSERSPIEDQWIVSRLSAAAFHVDKALKDYRFDIASTVIYEFFWGDFCDWYLEIFKLRLNFQDGSKRAVTETALTTIIAVFESTLKLLSPFMPFITEELWHALHHGDVLKKSIALTSYPNTFGDTLYHYAVFRIEIQKALITEVRALRKEIGVPDKEFVEIQFHGNPKTGSGPLGEITNHPELLKHLARVSVIHNSLTPLSGANSRSTPNFDVAILYERQIDIPAERERLTKELAKYEKGLAAADRQLSNETFMAKAPAHIVEGLRKQSTETRTFYDKTKAALEAMT